MKIKRQSQCGLESLKISLKGLWQVQNIKNVQIYMYSSLKKLKGLEQLT